MYMLLQVREGHLSEDLERTIKSSNFLEFYSASQNIEELPTLDIRSVDSQSTTCSINSITGIIQVFWLISQHFHRFIITTTATINTYTINAIIAAIATTLTNTAGCIIFTTSLLETICYAAI